MTARIDFLLFKFSANCANAYKELEILLVVEHQLLYRLHYDRIIVE